jgi:hypothetical protein
MFANEIHLTISSHCVTFDVTIAKGLKFILRGGNCIKFLVPSNVYVTMEREDKYYLLFFMSICLILVVTNMTISSVSPSNKQKDLNYCKGEPFSQLKKLQSIFLFATSLFGNQFFQK